MIFLVRTDKLIRIIRSMIFFTHPFVFGPPPSVNEGCLRYSQYQAIQQVSQYALTNIQYILIIYFIMSF